MKNYQQTCAREPFSVSVTTGSGIKGAVAHPTRHFSSHLNFAKCDLYGKTFPDSESASAAMLERGYTERYYSRSSVPTPAFASLASEKQLCAFDAGYRFFKHHARAVRRKGGGILAAHWLAVLEHKLSAQAKKVGIFHPVTRNWGKTIRNGREVSK